MSQPRMRAAALGCLALAFSLTACKVDPTLQATINAGNTQAALTAAAEGSTATAETTASETSGASTPSPSPTDSPTPSATPTSSIVEVTPCGQPICEINTPIGPSPTASALPTNTAISTATSTSPPTVAPSDTATARPSPTSTLTASPRPTATVTPNPSGCPAAPFAVPGRWVSILCDGFDGDHLNTAI